ncbi:TPA: winged helix-turn-helix transcriptional regulator [Pseudomonas aeruginosa]|nr:winged helix-turn-helix transcriptional regulator [Pseudomonas aeruginosa]HCR1716904.1 winged helix-turn-helix transcriptional regulator [Pseudomonas aeruginosa]
MKWQEVGETPCSMARSLAILGDRWTLPILRNCFLGMRRFDEFQASLGVTRQVLADRLSRLVEAGALKKVPYQERPPRYEYRLTEMGHDLHPVLLALANWGDRWLDEGRGAPVEYVHKACGHKFRPTMVCPECGEPVGSRDVTAVPGPGFAAMAGKLAQN